MCCRAQAAVDASAMREHLNASVLVSQQALRMSQDVATALKECVEGKLDETSERRRTSPTSAPAKGTGSPPRKGAELSAGIRSPLRSPVKSREGERSDDGRPLGSPTGSSVRFDSRFAPPCIAQVSMLLAVPTVPRASCEIGRDGSCDSSHRAAATAAARSCWRNAVPVGQHESGSGTGNSPL